MGNNILFYILVNKMYLNGLKIIKKESLEKLRMPMKAYEGLKSMELIGNFLPYHKYPMNIKVVDYIIKRNYFTSDVDIKNGVSITVEFIIE